VLARRRCELDLAVEGMDCPACALKVEAGARSVTGVISAEASAVTGALRVVHDGTVRPEDVAAAVKARGYRVRLLRRDPEREGEDVLRRRLGLAVGSGAFLAAAFLARWVAAAWTGAPPGWPSVLTRLAAALFLLSTALGGRLVAVRALEALRSRTVNFEVLVIVAALGAIALGDLPEAALVLFLFAVGETLEAAGVRRTRRALGSLLDLVPRTALVRREGRELEVPVAELRVGDTVIVRPGERLPVDGEVVAGLSHVNQAPVTGEAMPVAKGPGDRVFAGTVNGAGALEVVSTRDPEDTTLARVVHLVEEAQLRKARHQRQVDRFAAWYTPVVVGLAVVVGLVTPAVLGRPLIPYVYRALALLLVACPCALVLSTPVAVVAAIGQAARRGVLVKGGQALEAMGRAGVVALDKTGTLTVGRPEVSDVVVAPGAQVAGRPLDESSLLELAAAVEWRSEHPLAEAIRRRAALGSPETDGGLLATARNFEAIPGRGAKARVAGRNYYVGRRLLFESDLGVPTGELGRVGESLEREGKTVVYVGCHSEVLGLIAAGDTLRPEAEEAVARLRRAGVDRLVLLTGDNPATARVVAERLGLDDCRAGLLPETKVGEVEALAAALRPEGRTLVMVGDGVNDAPALAAADIGVAMGAAGTDQALEAADVALMSDDLRQVAYAVRLGRRAVAVIRQNVAVAVGIKVAALALASAGLLQLWMAVLADTGTTVLVILNGLRLLREDGPGTGAA